MAKKLIFLVILNISLIAAFLVGSAEESIEGVWTVRLRSCYLDTTPTSTPSPWLAPAWTICGCGRAAGHKQP